MKFIEAIKLAHSGSSGIIQRNEWRRTDKKTLGIMNPDYSSIDMIDINADDWYIPAIIDKFGVKHI